MMQLQNFVWAGLLAGLVVLNPGNAAAQYAKPLNLQGFDSRGVHFGFLLSLNSSDFFIELKPDYTFDSRLLSVENQRQGGFNLNLLASLDIVQNAHLRFEPGLSFQDRGLMYRFLDETGRIEQELKRTESVFLDLPLLWKLRTNRINNFAAYALVGGKYSIDMQSQDKVNNAAEEQKIVRLKRQDYSLDFGGGVDFFLPYFKFGLQMKVAVGLPNLLIDDGTEFTDPLQSLRTRTVVFSLTFEG